LGEKGKGFILYPYKYNFGDPQVEKDWKNTFVIYLLAKNKGIGLGSQYNTFIHCLASLFTPETSNCLPP